jgi:outer membrane protein OmpA-like peptidoglycan-associated protein
VLFRSQGIESWELALVHAERGVVRTFSGASPVPAQLSWDGAGAPEGLYTARFRVQYLKGNRPESSSTPFRLDVSPPQAAITLAPRPFSPDNDGVDDELHIRLDVEDASPIEAWALEILDPTGRLFKKYSGTGRPAREIIWDGLSPGGELVQAAEDYPVRLSVSDALGNTAMLAAVIPVDVLVIREGDKLKIRISSITFAANTADYLGVESDKVEKNLRALKRLAEIFEKYRAYNVRIEGHAVNVSWADPAAAEREEKEELAPLSLSRAEAVKEALVELGMDGRRITAAGLGGRLPVVPHGDLENRWKNRRVEFVLVRSDRAR